MSQLEIETRTAQVQTVSFPQRTIELVVMPYEREEEVEFHGRLITEVVSRGAFDGIQRRGDRRVKVNRGHHLDLAVGAVNRFDPNRDEGLVAEVYISRTELGDETLTLADDGILDASAGFGPLTETRNGRRQPKPGWEVWEGRSRRRLNHLWLDHIAMTPDPAYRDAKVLAVRAAADVLAGAREPTPNLDQVRGWILADRYAKLS
jgi:phage head maturation protease